MELLPVLHFNVRLLALPANMSSIKKQFMLVSKAGAYLSEARSRCSVEG